MYLYVCIGMYTWTYLCILTSVSMCMFIYIHICIWMYMYMCVLLKKLICEYSLGFPSIFSPFLNMECMLLIMYNGKMSIRVSLLLTPLSIML